MLSSDEIIYNILTNAQQDNELLQQLHIEYPSRKVAEESNSIFIAAVSSEPNNEMLDSTEYRDLVEILVTTKIRDYRDAVTVIKTVIREITRILKQSNEFDVTPIVRNIAPEYNSNFVLNKGHIMVEVLTEIEDNIPQETYDKVCSILINNIEVEW